MTTTTTITSSRGPQTHIVVASRAAAPSDTISGTADAALSATPRARGPQRPAPAFRKEAGAGVTRCDYCADGLHGGHHATSQPAELRITTDQPVHPYLIQLHRGRRLLAYAIRDAYGWAVTAKSNRRTRTVARAGQLWAVEAALLIHARGGAS